MSYDLCLTAARGKKIKKTRCDVTIATATRRDPWAGLVLLPLTPDDIFSGCELASGTLLLLIPEGDLSGEGRSHHLSHPYHHYHGPLSQALIP